MASLARIARAQRGITLIEIILVCAIVSAAAAGIFVFAKKASVTAAVETEQRQVGDVVKTVEALFATRPNFAALGTDGASYLKYHATRAGLKLGTDGNGNDTLLTGLGGSVVLEAATVDFPNGTPGTPNNGFALVYSGLAPDECVKLVSATAQLATRVDVTSGSGTSFPAGRSSGLSANTLLAGNGQLTSDKSTIASACKTSGDSASIVHLSFAPSRPTSVAAPPASRPVPPVCAPVHEFQTLACPAGQVGSITQERDGACTGANNAMVYTAWNTTNDTCAVPPIAPPTITPPLVVDSCLTTTITQVSDCPAGQTGQVIQHRDLETCSNTYTPWVTDASLSNCQPIPAATCSPETQTQTLACSAGMTGNITQSRSSTCSTPTSTPTWSAWETYSNTCQGTATCAPQRETGPVPCSVGMYGPSTGDRERYRNCVSPTAPGAWTAWNILVPNNTCTLCPASTTQSATQWAPQSAACPSGQAGDYTWEAEQVSTLTVSYNCPVGTTSLPAPSYSGWSAWTNTGATRNVVNTCTLTCVPPASTTETRTSTPCPSGSSGVITEQRTTSWSCPTTTGAPVSSTSAWTTTSNTCAGNCVVPSPSTQTNTETRTATQNVACPTGQTGTHTQSRNEVRTQTRTASCPTTTGPVSWSAWSGWSAWTPTSSWTTTSNTCAPILLPSCWCTGSLYNGSAYFVSWGSFQTMAECQAAKAPGQVCEYEAAPVPLPNYCVHLMDAGWRTFQPAEMFCRHI